MEKVRVVFIGGLSNGKIIYDYLNRNKYVDLSLTITYPDDYSGARHTVIPSNNNIVKSTSTIDAVRKIREASPDLIIVAGWSEIISKEILDHCFFSIIKLFLDEKLSASVYLTCIVVESSTFIFR